MALPPLNTVRKFLAIKRRKNGTRTSSCRIFHLSKGWWPFLWTFLLLWLFFFGKGQFDFFFTFGRNAKIKIFVPLVHFIYVCFFFLFCFHDIVVGLITVMCYNVLCDKYATRQMYGYCPTWALAWEYRKKNILAEIRHYTADIISLQVYWILFPD